MRQDLTSLKVRYAEQGFAVLEGLFEEDELALICKESDLICGVGEVPCPHEGRVEYEGDGTSLRTRFGIHLDTPVFSRLARDVRCAGAAREVLGDEVYLHQSRLNAKTAFAARDFGWHQDLAYWSPRDGIPGPSILSVALFVDDVTPVNAPMFVIPGSHTAGLLPTTDYNLSRAQVSSAAAKFGIEAILGQRGTMLIFSSTLIHSSPPNISPVGRRILFFCYNALSNVRADTGAASFDFLASRDFTAIVPETGQINAS
ncbi:phytanoyl-CoA dioxygenase family protein [Mesorhizobium amorphae]|uniref:phytanoyl-CoA dioxygenase family protein n=1 Tax=Mesorhizobium amorphae TaxID=71433 RepID=UPI00177CAADF|nr:phytanoyl-CoA dioxygenase family protein [Mesorhizobium amorphae]